MSETETVTINLDGSFAAEASKDATAAEQLAHAFEAMTKAAAAYHDPQAQESARYSAITGELNAQAAVQAKIQSFDAARYRALQQQEAVLRRMQHDALAGTGLEKKEGGKDAGEAFTRGLLPGADRLGTSAGLAGVGGQLIAQGAGKLIEAAEEVAHAAADITVSAGKLAIAMTSKRDVQGAIGEKLGGNYEQSVHMALAMGIDPEEAWQQTKKLLGDKFKNEEIPALIRIKTGMSAEGQNGEAFITELQRLKLEPKVRSADLDRLYKMGIDSKAVYAELAKTMGVDVATATAKVKSGAADSEQVIAALEKVAAQRFGASADIVANSVEALYARILGEGKELFAFDPSVLDPIKEALRTVLGIMEGPEGAELKATLQELFVSVESLFDGVSSDDVKADLRIIVTELKELKRYVDDNKDGLKAFGRALEFIAGASVEGIKDELVGMMVVASTIGDAWAWAEEIPGRLAEADEAVRSFVDDVEAAPGRMLAEAEDMGRQLVQGFADGITGGASEAITAAEKMATDALAAAKNALGIHSPSDAFADEVGDPSAEGLALGMTSHPGPAAAGAQMASSALGGAHGALGGGAGGAGAGGGGDVHVTIQVSGAGGSAAQEWHALLPTIETALRRIQRDRFEGA